MNYIKFILQIRCDAFSVVEMIVGAALVLLTAVMCITLYNSFISEMTIVTANMMQSAGQECTKKVGANTIKCDKNGNITIENANSNQNEHINEKYKKQLNN